MMSLRSLPWTRVAAVALLGAAAACGSASIGADGIGGGDYNQGPAGGTSDAGGGTQFAPDDAGVAGSAATGNILCNGTKTSCVPDGEDPTLSGCGDPYSGSIDGGPSGGGPDDASTLSCHVVAVADDGGYELAPTCTASGGGHNGASCSTSSECASGFECVGHPGTCRRYCCDSNCKDQTFCDIQNETSDSKVKVPVCEPVKACTLLNAAQQCNTDETCTVVDENGTTSCVATGPALVGQSCDTVHCAADLVCLGDLNARKCYELCSTSAGDCPSGLTCMSSAPLFREGDVGVCQ